MTVKKALIIEGVYLHAVDAPEVDDIQVYVSDDTVDITTHHRNTISLDFEELDAINALVAEARNPKRMVARVRLDTHVRESERRAVEGARNPAPTWPPDWSKIPVGFDHAAVDADGRAWAYPTKPTTIRFMWAGGWLDPVKDLGSVILPPGMTWQESYCKRPPVDDLAFLGLSWADVPERYDYVAADKNGDVYAYTSPPRTRNITWHAVDYGFIANRDTFGDWEESLRIRPTAMKQILGIDWADVPADLHYVAADHDGRVFGYKQCPEKYVNVWRGDDWVKLTEIVLPPI